MSIETDCLGHSLSAQVSYYCSLIQGSFEWEFDGAEFEKPVKEITAFPDGSLACHFYGGKVKTWQRT